MAFMVKIRDSIGSVYNQLQSDLVSLESKEDSFYLRICKIWNRFLAYFSTPEKLLRKRIEKISIQKLYEALKGKLNPNVKSIYACDESNFKYNEQFSKQVLSIVREINRANYEIGQGRVEVGTSYKIRKMLHEAIEHPIYQELKEAQDPLINFIQLCAIKLISADAREALRAYGENRIGKKEEVEFHDLGASIRKELTHSKLSHRNSLWGNIEWGICNPKKAWKSKRGHWLPLEYDAHNSNPSFYGFDLSLKGKKIHFYYGPTPIGDKVFSDALLFAYRKLGVTETRFNHMSTSRGFEREMLQESHRHADQKTFKHALFSFDDLLGHPEGKKLIKIVNQPEEFFKQYIPLLKDGIRQFQNLEKANPGVKIPEALLSDAEIEEVLKSAQELFRILPLEKIKKDKNKVQTIHQATMALLMAKVTVKQLQQAPENHHKDRDLNYSRITGACKQDIDRGPVHNQLLRIFIRLLENDKPFTAEEAYEIAGGVLSRALITDDRQPQEKRVRVLCDLLQLISPKREAVAQLLRNAFIPKLHVIAARQTSGLLASCAGGLKWLWDLYEPRTG
jgi:hypothetical protein